jgi:hypothetical protein
MKNDKNKFKLEFNQLFVGKGIGHILYFHIGIISYMRNLSDVFSC